MSTFANESQEVVKMLRQMILSILWNVVVVHFFFPLFVHFLQRLPEQMTSRVYM